MQRTATLVSVRALALLAGLTPLAAGCGTTRHDAKENEAEVTLDQVPPAVRETISRESGGAPVGTVERVRGQGKTIYEVKMTKGAKTQEIKIDEAGNVVGRH